MDAGAKMILGVILILSVAYVLVSIWLLILGVDYPVLWGLVAFLFNYVPNIGSIIAAVPALLLALVQLGPWAAFWSGLGYLAINALVGNVIEPRFMGKGLGLSPLIVFISTLGKFSTTTKVSKSGFKPGKPLHRWISARDACSYGCISNWLVRSRVTRFLIGCASSRKTRTGTVLAR